MQIKCFNQCWVLPAAGQGLSGTLGCWVLCLKESIDNNKKSESRSDFKQNKVKKRQNVKIKKNILLLKK